MKYCTKCGGQVEDGDVFCGYCGSKLTDSSPREDEKNNFREESFEKNDFGVDFDRDFQDDFRESSSARTDNYNKDGDVSDDIDREFESYVERDNDIANSGNVYNRSNSNGPVHKKLLPNKYANNANTFGILAIVFGFLGGVLGIVFGIIGLTQAKKAQKLCDTGDYDGKPKASNGKILSIVGIALGIISLVYYFL